MGPKNFPILWGGKIGGKISQKLNLGYGSTWPGHVALQSNKNFIRDVLKKNKDLKIVLIAGTNGKTTTSKLLKHILEKDGLKVFLNESGANLLNGFASTIIKHTNLFGRLPFDVAIFEVDENSLPSAVDNLNPNVLVLLNLFRDQLDRYGEVNLISKKWSDVTENMRESTLFIVNGDDPGLREIGGRNTLYFGVNEGQMTGRKLTHDVDFVYCPRCHSKLNFSKISYSHIGKYTCPKCKLTNPEITKVADINYPLEGLYNEYNTNAAILVAQKLFQISINEINHSLESFKPAFGRQEIISYKNRKIMILLSKNPAGFNQSIEVVNNHRGEKTVLLVLNDRIPDGRDVSWIWDVDFEKLEAKNVVISGDRTYDMALRMQYTQKSIIHHSSFIIHEDLSDAIESSLKLTETEQTLFVLPTYSAMLETRKIILGRKIL